MWTDCMVSSWLLSVQNVQLLFPTVCQYLLQFISQILLAEIRAVLREKDSDSKYTLESILAVLSTLDVLEYEGRRGLSEITKNVRTVLKLFDTEVPKGPLYYTEMFDPSVLLNPVTKGTSLIDGD